MNWVERAEIKRSDKVEQRVEARVDQHKNECVGMLVVMMMMKERMRIEFGQAGERRLDSRGQREEGVRSFPEVAGT